jgi:hypothetical protein
MTSSITRGRRLTARRGTLRRLREAPGGGMRGEREHRLAARDQTREEVR